MPLKKKKWGFGLLVILLAISTLAQNKRVVTVKIHPESIKLPSKIEAEATLVIHNNGEKDIENVKVDCHQLAGVKVQISSPPVSTMPPGSTFDCKLKISLEKSEGAVSGDIIFHVSYYQKNEGGKELRKLIFNKLTVENRDYINADEVAKIEVYSSLAELKDFRPGYIYLHVKNKSVTPINISRIEVAERPKFIILKPVETESQEPGETESQKPGESSTLKYPDGMKRVPAKESRVFPVHVSAGDKVRPGKHLLMFNVFFNRTVNGETQTGSLVAKHEIDVNVFGEKEVLGAFTNISSFLILPGFLIILIAGMLWKLLVPPPQKDKLKIDVKTPKFWAVAIALSLLMAWIGYPFLTSLIPGLGHRDFLSGYGFHDIIWMCLFSITIGVLFSVISAFVIRTLQQIKAAKEKMKLEKAIKKTDSPMEMLKKLVEKEVSTVRYREAEIKSSKLKGFIVEKEQVNKQSYWLSPRITIWWYEEDNEIRGKVVDLIEKKKDLKEIVELLEEGENLGENDKKGIAKVEWREKQGEVEMLTEVAVSELDFKNEWKDIFSHETANR